MKRTLLTLAAALLALSVGYAPAVDAQASFTATTLANAITTPIASPGQSIPTNTVTLTSGTGVTTQSVLYVDRELMRVTDISRSPTFTVTRAISGTIISAHAALAPVKVGLPQWFGSADKAGACTATAEVALPYINVNNGKQFACTNSTWVVSPFFTTCGTVAACSPVNASGTVKIVSGSVALATGSPSAATVTAISPAFTSSTSYVCAVAPVGADATIAGAGVAVSNVSGTSFTLTGQNTVTTVINYVCVGT